jgi:hypothetical protein
MAGRSSTSSSPWDVILQSLCGFALDWRQSYETRLETLGQWRRREWIRPQWAFADFEDEYVALDLPHIPEPTRSEMTKELELRFQQLQMLLQAFHTE